MLNDGELLREYAECGSEEAFQVLVERHSGMVHGVAIRVVRNEPFAEEITQAVFVILARKAAGLRPKTVVAGWLYRTARFVALEAIRRERRRLEHEERLMQIEENTESASVWEQITPQLDEALDSLGKTDREAVVLRFLEQRSFAEVALALSTTEAAAKMRVGRALDKLRSALGQCGVAVPAAALLAALSSHGATAAPATLVASVTASALAHTGAVESSISGLVKGALMLMTWNKVKIGAVAVVLLLLLGGGGVAVWKWQPRSTAGAPLVLRTFEPMNGEWEGTFTLTRDGRVLVDSRSCSMSVTTQQGGRVCEIELRTSMAPGAEPMTQHYAHTVNEQGNRLFTVSDPASGRGDGECEITESFHDPVAKQWRAAMRFPLPGGRGEMNGSWECRGDTLVVRSHDEFFAARGSSHVLAELQLHRRARASAIP
jgi:RNA polymerase sigma factor (sigma-70 family)